MVNETETRGVSVESRTIRKLRTRIIPFIFVLYVIAFIDRINIAFAALTMNKELAITSQQFGMLSGIFFIGYFFFEIDGLAMQNRKKFSGKFWGSGFSKWVELFESSFSVLAAGQGGHSGASTLVLAALNGLLHDFLATGDYKRTTAALHYLIEKISDAPAAPARIRGK